MKKYWFNCFAALTAGSLLLLVSLGASENKEDVRLVGSRMTPENTLIQSQTNRSLFSKVFPDAQTDEEEALYFAEAGQLSNEEIHGKAASLENQMDPAAKDDIRGKSTHSNTSHLGAHHYPRYVTPFGDSVVLEDGSRWSICGSDHHKVMSWYTSDCLLITPNHDWFSSHEYKIHNLATDQIISVNLVEAPNYNGLFTHWIVAIDYIHKKLCLEDGSVWSISIWDDAELKRMCLEDTIIIGTNDSWFKTSRPNILLNVDTMEYIKARCDY